MNIVVGYVQSCGDAARQAAQVRALIALGCQTVRVEGAAAPERAFKPVLDAVCDFLGPGDRLLVPDVTHLGCSPSAVETFQDRLEARGTELGFLDPESLAEAVHPVGPVQIMPTASAPPAGPKGVDAGMVLALSAHGFGPSQIARKLGVSRMTVWRRLSAAGA